MAAAIDYESENKDYAIQLDVEKGIVRKLRIVGSVGKYEASDVATEAEKMEYVPMVTTRLYSNGDRLKAKGKMRSNVAAETIRTRQGLTQVSADETKKKKETRLHPQRRNNVRGSASLEALGITPIQPENVETTTGNGQPATANI